MNWRVPSKVAALVALGVASWFCTSRIIAQGRPPKVNVQAQQGQVLPGFTKAKGNGPANLPGQAPVRATASFEFEEMAVKIAAGKAGVHAQVKIEDSRPGKSYVWTLLVKDSATGGMVLNNNYAHQEFAVKRGEIARPTFDEAFGLRPGAYNVELRLYETAPAANLDEMNKGDVFQPQLLLSSNQDIVVE